MNSALTFYAKFWGLFIVLILVIGLNVAVWGLHRPPAQPALYVPGAHPERGPEVMQKYGCGTCHTIPGVRGAVGKVGPRLDRMTELVYIAGVLPNTPQNLTFWIANPRKSDPLTAMPDLGVTEQDARDMAAYLYRQR